MSPTVSVNQATGNSGHRFTFDHTPGLVATWWDVTCSCGWQLTTSGRNRPPMAQAEQHLDDQDAETADFDALCSL